MTKRLLFVCLGNICRSPAAEGIFLHKIKTRGLEECFFIDSAGTGAWHVGQKADARMRAAAKRRGVVLPSLARQITLLDFERFDLILTMDTDNLQAVTNMEQKVGSKAIAKVMPILSFSRQSKFLDVPDPYYGGDSGFEIVLDLLDDACEGLLESINSMN